MKTNKKYKATLFTSIFSEITEIIPLYNALTNKNYSEDTEVEIKTLPNVLYMDSQNDLSFVIDGKFVVLIEHQSSQNENMPLRLLMYVARVYESIIERRKLYYANRFNIPKPEFIVLYNGTKDYPQETELKLSDAFFELLEGETPNLELIVRVININYGLSAEIMQKDKTLEDYSYFIHLVRENQKTGLDLDASVEKAINNCISMGRLKKFLEENSSEVVNMLFGEWDYATAIEVAKEEGLQQGIELGIEQGIEKGIEQGIEKGIEQGIEKGIKQGIEKGIDGLTRSLLSAKEMIQNGVPRNEIQQKLNLTPQLMQLI